MRLPWMKSCLHADFGFGARYFQVVDTGEFMVELYHDLPVPSHAQLTSEQSAIRSPAFAVHYHRSGSTGQAGEFYRQPTCSQDFLYAGGLAVVGLVTPIITVPIGTGTVIKSRRPCWIF